MDGFVFLLDDEPTVLRAMERVLRAEGFVVQGWTCAADFLAAHDALIPGCLVTDVCMPGMGGLELQRKLLDGGTDRSIVFITGRGDIPTTVQAFKLGAVTLLTKPVERASLLAAVSEAIARDLARCARYQERTEVLRRLATLTPRERQVLEHVANGRLNKLIAADLGTAEKTIKIHRRRVMDKMQVRSSVGLVRLLSQVLGFGARGSGHACSDLPLKIASELACSRDQSPCAISDSSCPGAHPE